MDFSFSNSLSKGSVYESDSIFKAYRDDAASRLAEGVAPQAISNERIRQGDEILQTYAVTSDAIHGGMGSVWRVHHQSWNADLAMKRPQPRFFAEGSERRKADFIAECEHWIDLGLHPNIVSCYYVREIGGVPTIFSEWMDGGSLKDAIQSGRLYGEGEAAVRARILDIAIQMARGLRYSHGNGLVHQDVKPGNILLTGDWEAKVADFGLARAQSQLSDGSVSGSTGYTPQYCPREQAEGADAAPWMDVYAWALTVLEMYRGGRDWRTGAEAAENREALLASCVHALPDGMKALLDRCLAHGSDMDFAGVEQALTDIYRATCEADYPRPAPQAVANDADALNNRALSFIDLGKEALAEALWKEALEKTPNHLASIYNQGLYQWRRSEIDDEEVLRRCAASNMSRGSEGLAGRWLRQVNGERGVSESKMFEQSDNCRVIDGFKYGTRVALTKDGKRLYTASDTLRCYDTQTMECLFETPADHISACAILLSKDEKRVLFGGYDKKFKAADAATGELIFASEACDGAIQHLCLHPNGRICYSLSERGESALCKWDVGTGRRLSYIRGEKRNYSGLSISPDGRHLYYCAGKLIQKEDPGLERETRVYARSTAVTEDGARLYAVGEFTTRIVDTDTLKVVKEFPCVGYQSRLAGHDAKLISADRSLKIWDTRTLRCERTMFGHTTTVTGISASDDLSLIATGSKDDHTVRLWRNPGPGDTVPAPWELSVARGYLEVSDTQNRIRALADSIGRAIDDGDDERALAELKQAELEPDAEGDEQIRILRRKLTCRCDRTRLAEVYEIGGVDSIEDKYSLRGIAVNGVTGELAVITLRKYVCLWDADLTTRTDLPTRDQAFCACFSASGEYLAAGLRGQVMIWRREAGGYAEYKLLRHVDPAEEHSIEQICFSPDGRTLFSGNSEGEFTLVDIASGAVRCIRRLDDDMPRIQAMAFSPDGERVVTLNIHGAFMVHRVRDGALLFEDRIKGIASRVCFSPDGSRLYFSGYGLSMEPNGPGQLMCAMDTADWRIIERKTYLEKTIRLSLENITLSPDGRCMATGKDSVILWGFPEMERLFELQVPERSKLSRVSEIAFSGDMTRLYVISYNRIIAWELKWELRPRGQSGDGSRAEEDLPVPDAAVQEEEKRPVPDAAVQEKEKLPGPDADALQEEAGTGETEARRSALLEDQRKLKDQRDAPLDTIGEGDRAELKRLKEACERTAEQLRARSQAFAREDGRYNGPEGRKLNADIEEKRRELSRIGFLFKGRKKAVTAELSALEQRAAKLFVGRREAEEALDAAKKADAAARRELGDAEARLLMRARAQIDAKLAAIQAELDALDRR